MLARATISFRRFPFAWLFFSLLLTLGAHPILQEFELDLLEAFLAFNLLTVILTTGTHIRIFAALLGGFIIFRAVNMAFSIALLVPLGDGLWIVGCAMGILATASHVLRPGPVDRERIFAALDLYLLAGIFFAVSYRVLDVVFPGSFSIPALSLDHALYFSFVTLATLGYGDIVPVSEAARGLVVFEAVGGQIYLAVLVARLVSLYSNQNSPK